MNFKIVNTVGDATDVSTFLTKEQIAVNYLFEAHQVNCLGIMGAGIALQYANKYPKLLEGYKAFCKGAESTLLGSTYLFKINPKHFVLNIFGQEKTGTHKRQTSYDALDKAISDIFEALKANSSVIVSFPKYFGCALGGGDWKVVTAIIEAAALRHNFSGTIYYVEYKKQGS